MTQSTTGDPSEPYRSFQSAELKVQWAEKQIGDLTRAVERLTEEFKSTKGSTYDPRLGIGKLGNLNVHPFMGCLAGDILFSLRSALDCCWMGLRRAIKANAGKDTLPRGTLTSVIALISRSGVESAFPGIERFLIQDLQAYEGGNEILWFVAQVDNWNKHNRLIIVAQETIIKNATMRVPSGPTVIFDNVTIKGFPDGDAFGITSSGRPEFLPNSDISFALKLRSQKPLDERDLMPFLHSALTDTRKGVGEFMLKFGTLP